MKNLYLAEITYQTWSGDPSDISIVRIVYASNAEEAQEKANTWFNTKWNGWNDAYNHPQFTGPSIEISEPI